MDIGTGCCPSPSCLVDSCPTVRVVPTYPPRTCGLVDGLTTFLLLHTHTPTTPFVRSRLLLLFSLLPIPMPPLPRITMYDMAAVVTPALPLRTVTRTRRYLAQLPTSILVRGFPRRS